MPEPIQPPEPPTVPGGTSLAHVVERVVEFIHLTSQHRDDGIKPRLHSCPEDPCVTWRAFLRDSRWMG